MSRKYWGFTYSGIGLLMVLFALFADSVGIGDTAGYGYTQIAGIIIGGLVLIIGLYMAWAGSQQERRA